MNLTLPPSLERIRERFPGRRKRGDPRPARAWIGILACACVFGLSLTGYSAWFYINVQRVEKDNTAPSSSTQQPFDQAFLNGTVEQYRTRAIRFETMRRTSESVPNPGTLDGILAIPVQPTASTSEEVRIE